MIIVTRSIACSNNNETIRTLLVWSLTQKILSRNTVVISSGDVWSQYGTPSTPDAWEKYAKPQTLLSHLVLRSLPPSPTHTPRKRLSINTTDSNEGLTQPPSPGSVTFGTLLIPATPPPGLSGSPRTQLLAVSSSPHSHDNPPLTSPRKPLQWRPNLSEILMVKKNLRAASQKKACNALFFVI